jgi:hypothetical protein
MHSLSQNPSIWNITGDKEKLKLIPVDIIKGKGFQKTSIKDVDKKESHSVYWWWLLIIVLVVLFFYAKNKLSKMLL